MLHRYLLVALLLSGCTSASRLPVREMPPAGVHGSPAAVRVHEASVPVPLPSACDTTRHLGAIVGVVREEQTDRPLAHVRVSVPDFESLLRHRPGACSTLTDSLGRYRIAGVPPGTHRLEVTRIGYGTEQRSTVVASRGEPVTVDFHLRVVPVVIAGCEKPRASEAERREAIREGDPLFRPVPRRITRKWVLRAFPECMECCPYYKQRDSLWSAVRDRPDLVDAYIRIVEDESEIGGVRAQAIRGLGATGQERAYDYLLRLLGRLSQEEYLREDVILALGLGPEPPPRVIDALTQLLHNDTSDDRYHARHALEILERLRRERPRPEVSEPTGISRRSESDACRRLAS